MSDAYAAEAAQPLPSAETPTQSEEPATPTDARVALVTRLNAEIETANKKWMPVFKRMRKNMRFASGKQYQRSLTANENVEDERIKVEIVQRHVSQRTAALYARNPTVLAKRKPRLDFQLWDGTPEQLMKAAERFATTGVVMPEDEALFLDIQQGMTHRKMLKRVADTMRILFTHFMDIQDPPFKLQCKQLVPRTLTCGVGYIKVGYQRELGPRQGDEIELNDVTRQIATIERLRKAGNEGALEETSADYERLRLMMKDITSRPQVVIREGLVFNFPRATNILPDAQMTQVEGFLGCDWVAEKFYMRKTSVEEDFGVKLNTASKSYSLKKDGSYDKDVKGDFVCVYKLFHKRDGLVYTLCEGHNDFIAEPTSPEIYVRAFWPWVPLVFNRGEDDEEPFPRSDVELLEPLQRELNRTFESRRQHRVASRPLYVSPPGALSEEDKKSLDQHPAHAIIELANLPEDGKIEWVLKQVDKAAIDPNVYETGSLYDAIGRVVGGPEAANGGQSRGSATGDSIAEASRVSALASNADDLDECLSQVAEIGGGILLLEMEPETVSSIVGPGAVWPQATRQDIASELYLTIRGGSTGRPNKTQDIANFERMAPFLLQLPGLSQDAVAEYAIRLMDDNVDLAEFMSAGAASIVASNANSQPGTGNPATEPTNQGGAGGGNKSKANGTEGGGQPAYPGSTGTGAA